MDFAPALGHALARGDRGVVSRSRVAEMATRTFAVDCIGTTRRGHCGAAFSRVESTMVAAQEKSGKTEAGCAARYVAEHGDSGFGGGNALEHGTEDAHEFGRAGAPQQGFHR